MPTWLITLLETKDRLRSDSSSLRQFSLSEDEFLAALSSKIAESLPRRLIATDATQGDVSYLEQGPGS